MKKFKHIALAFVVPQKLCCALSLSPDCWDVYLLLASSWAAWLGVVFLGRRGRHAPGLHWAAKRENIMDSHLYVRVRVTNMQNYNVLLHVSFWRATRKHVEALKAVVLLKWSEGHGLVACTHTTQCISVSTLDFNLRPFFLNQDWSAGHCDLRHAWTKIPFPPKRMQEVSVVLLFECKPIGCTSVWFW